MRSPWLSQNPHESRIPRPSKAASFWIAVNFARPWKAAPLPPRFCLATGLFRCSKDTVSCEKILSEILCSTSSTGWNG